jgi:phospholipase C
VRGPNGFHRHFAGDLAGAQTIPSIDWRLTDRKLRISVGSSRVALRVTAGAYAEHHHAWRAPARGGENEWDLRATNGWYDFVITIDEHAAFRRRLAGRVDAGDSTTTDPALNSPRAGLSLRRSEWIA